MRTRVVKIHSQETGSDYVLRIRGEKKKTITKLLPLVMDAINTDNDELRAKLMQEIEKALKRRGYSYVAIDVYPHDSATIYISHKRSTLTDYEIDVSADGKVVIRKLVW